MSEHVCPYCSQPMPLEARKHSPQDATARALAKALGASIPFCRKQVAALITTGWPLGRIQEAIRHAEPGQAPWDWTKKVTSKPKKDYGDGPSAPPGPPSMKQLASAVGMTVEQYREFHGIEA